MRLQPVNSRLDVCRQGNFQNYFFSAAGMDEAQPAGVQRLPIY